MKCGQEVGVVACTSLNWRCLPIHGIISYDALEHALVVDRNEQAKILQIPNPTDADGGKEPSSYHLAIQNPFLR
ncbi:unnamed protein product [Taenia asiatica]|uniref:CN hydrolase domain-containing protein n=1 Tax=Taenia asiatica TaxID=60517 RepID=A0A0R3VXX5_TAEAS|nr:unnamed protein product [Taenia asiatica]